MQTLLFWKAACHFFEWALVLWGMLLEHSQSGCVCSGQQRLRCKRRLHVMPWAKTCSHLTKLRKSPRKTDTLYCKHTHTYTHKHIRTHTGYMSQLKTRLFLACILSTYHTVVISFSTAQVSGFHSIMNHTDCWEVELPQCQAVCISYVLDKELSPHSDSERSFSVQTVEPVAWEVELNSTLTISVI